MSVAALIIVPKPEPLPPAEPAPQDRAVVTIGALLSLTGDFIRQGTEMYRGYQLALEAINEQGVNINGVKHNLDLVIYDDESSPVRVIEVANLLIDRDQPLAILAPYSSSLTSPLLPIAQARDTPLIVPIASPAGLNTSRGGVFTIQTPPSGHLAGAAALFVAHVTQLSRQDPDNDKLFRGGNKPAVLIAGTGDNHSSFILNEVVSTLRKNGIEQIDTFDLSLDEEAYAEEVAKLETADAMFVAAYASGNTRLMETIATEGINLPYLALTHCVVANINQKEPTAAEGALCALHWQVGASFPGTEPLTSRFENDYYDKFGSRPTHYAAAAAAALQVMSVGLQRATVLDIELTDAISQTNLATFYGPIKFDRQGRNIGKQMVLSQINQARYFPVFPVQISQQAANFSRPQLSKAQ